jgi:hypothetical protein
MILKSRKKIRLKQGKIRYNLEVYILTYMLEKCMKEKKQKKIKLKKKKILLKYKKEERDFKRRRKKSLLCISQKRSHSN